MLLRFLKVALGLFCGLLVFVQLIVFIGDITFKLVIKRGLLLFKSLDGLVQLFNLYRFCRDILFKRLILVLEWVNLALELVILALEFSIVVLKFAILKLEIIVQLSQLLKLPIKIGLTLHC